MQPITTPLVWFVKLINPGHEMHARLPAVASTVLYVRKRTVPDAVRPFALLYLSGACEPAPGSRSRTAATEPASTMACLAVNDGATAPASWAVGRGHTAMIIFSHLVFCLLRAEMLISYCTLSASIVRPSISESPDYGPRVFFCSHSSIGLSAEGENSEPKCSRTKRLVHLRPAAARAARSLPRSISGRFSSDPKSPNPDTRVA